jgi:hypothetical protein
MKPPGTFILGDGSEVLEEFSTFLPRGAFAQPAAKIIVLDFTQVGEWSSNQAVQPILGNA